MGEVRKLRKALALVGNAYPIILAHHRYLVQRYRGSNPAGGFFGGCAQRFLREPLGQGDVLSG